MAKKQRESGRLISVVLSAALSIAFLLFLLRSDIAIDYMKTGLKLCSETVIPSLFPFMVVSSLLVSSGIGIKLFSFLAIPFKLLFGVSEGGACAFILGALCGFPIGARTVCDLYDGGRIGKKEAERILTFCNNPGSAFVTGAVGVSLFGSPRIGLCLYVCVILSSIITGMALRPFFKIDRKKCLNSMGALQTSLTARGGIGAMFTGAIRDSALSMLTVCATVTFFSSLVGCIGASLSALGVSDTVIASVFGIFEISSGVSALAALPHPVSVVFCAAALGWSGLSVHLQIMSVCAGRDFSFAPYFLAKALQGTVCAALVWGILALFPSLSEVFAALDQESARASRIGGFLFVITVLSACLLIGTLISAVERMVEKRYAKKR